MVGGDALPRSGVSVDVGDRGVFSSSDAPGATLCRGGSETEVLGAELVLAPGADSAPGERNAPEAEWPLIIPF